MGHDAPAVLLALVVLACAPTPNGPHWERRCVSSHRVATSGGFLGTQYTRTVCDSLDSVWVAARPTEADPR